MNTDQIKKRLAWSDDSLAMLDKLIGYSNGTFTRKWHPAEEEYWLHVRKNIFSDPKRWLRGKKFKTTDGSEGRFFFIKDLGEMLKILAIEKDGKILLEDHSQLG